MLKLATLACIGFFIFLMGFSSASVCSQDVPGYDQLESLAASYLKDLEELGYCVIPQVFTATETEQLYQRVWH